MSVLFSVVQCTHWKYFNRANIGEMNWIFSGQNIFLFQRIKKKLPSQSLSGRFYDENLTCHTTSDRISPFNLKYTQTGMNSIYIFKLKEFVSKTKKPLWCSVLYSQPGLLVSTRYYLLWNVWIINPWSHHIPQYNQNWYPNLL